MNTLPLIAIVAVFALAGCAEDAPPAADPVSGMPADGGLSVGEARTSELDGPLTVGGYLVADGDTVRLCEALAESFPPQCGGESLTVEGLDIGAYEPEAEGEVRWTADPVTVTGEVDGETLRVSDTTM